MNNYFFLSFYDLGLESWLNAEEDLLIWPRIRVQLPAPTLGSPQLPATPGALIPSSGL